MEWPFVFAIVGFLLAAYSIVANDAIQTLGPFISANEKRPWWVLWCYACGVLMVVFIYGWIVNDGDASYGRLAKFPEPTGGITWLHVVPPIIILILTRFSIPVSTTFLILTVFAPSNMTQMVIKSALGYALAFVLAMIIYYTVARALERMFIRTKDQPPASYWIGLQWAATGFLWSQWLVQDLANIFVYLPRTLDITYLLFAVAVMLILHAIIFMRRGGEIQGIVNSKTNIHDVRSATIVNVIYGMILLFFKEYSNMPMSTTWVFLGLLAGREFAIGWVNKLRSMAETSKIVGGDALKAGIGLAVSVAIALALPRLYVWVEGPVSEAKVTRPAPTRQVDATPRPALPVVAHPTEKTAAPSKPD